MQVYELARKHLEFDLVWFMGVFYHLRYPLPALDIIARKMKRLMVFQTMTMPEEEVSVQPQDIDINQRNLMLSAGWPKLAFIEYRLSGDPTNWWAPNRSAVEAMLRSCGFDIVHRPAHETYICRPGDSDYIGMVELIERELRASAGTTPVTGKEIREEAS